MGNSENENLPGSPVMGLPYFSEFYLQVLHQILTVNIGENSHHASSRGGKGLEIGQSILFP